MDIVCFAMPAFLPDESGDFPRERAIVYLIGVAPHAPNEESFTLGKRAGESVEEVGDKNIVAKPVPWRVFIRTLIEFANMNRHRRDGLSHQPFLAGRVAASRV